MGPVKGQGISVDQTETEEDALEIEKSREIDVSEFELDLCIKRLHLCFVSVNDLSMIFISHLQPVILVLLELHCRINFGVSHLRNSVEQIVQRFLRWSGKSKSLIFYSYGFEEIKGFLNFQKFN